MLYQIQQRFWHTIGIKNSFLTYCKRRSLVVNSTDEQRHGFYYIMKKLFLLPLFILLSACSTFESSYTPPLEGGESLGKHYMTWDKRQAQLSAIRNWVAQGN